MILHLIRESKYVVSAVVTAGVVLVASQAAFAQVQTRAAATVGSKTAPATATAPALTPEEEAAKKALEAEKAATAPKSK
jgi:hypothetical protein